MEDKVYYQSEYEYTVQTHKEFTSSVQHSMILSSIVNLIYLVYIVFLTIYGISTFTRVILLALNFFYIGLVIYRYFRDKDGGLAYKRLFHQNQDLVPRQIATLKEDGIHGYNPDTQKTNVEPYDRLRYIIEAKNLVILVTDLKMYIILDKRTLSGGTSEEVIQFLRKRCPNLKKRIKKGTVGKIIRYALIAIIGPSTAITMSFLIRDYIKQTKQLPNHMSYEEMAEVLQTAGVKISSKTIDEMRSFDDEYALEYGEYYTDNPKASKVQDLLTWEGCGTFDEDSFQWTPSESGIYWFDMEIMNVASMYTDFLNGVSAMDETLTFTDIHEDFSEADMETGEGTIHLSFVYEGQPHTLTAVFYYDWFDISMLHSLGTILYQDSHDADLWYAFDNGQGILLFYGTEADANSLNGMSGFNLTPCHSMETLN